MLVKPQPLGDQSRRSLIQGQIDLGSYIYIIKIHHSVYSGYLAQGPEVLQQVFLSSSFLRLSLCGVMDMHTEGLEKHGLEQEVS